MQPVPEVYKRKIRIYQGMKMELSKAKCDVCDDEFGRVFIGTRLVCYKCYNAYLKKINAAQNKIFDEIKIHG